MTTAKEKMEKRKHHPLSASKLQYVEACPAFRGEDSHTEAADAGTRQHAAMESGIDDGLDDDEQAAVNKCRDYVQQVRAGLIEQWGGIGEEISEEYVAVDDRKVKDETGYVWSGSSGGSFDLAFVSPDRTEAVCIDYKFGKHPVEPVETNLQGIVYSLGLKRRIPTLKAVSMTFLMPYLDIVDTCTFTDFSKMLLRVKTVVDRAFVAQPERNASENLCIWCGNRGTCPAVAKYAIEVSRKFAPLKVPDDISPDRINDPDMAAVGIRLADLVKKWAESYRAACTMMVLEEPSTLPEGYDLRRVVDRVVLDKDKLRAVASAYGVTATDFDAMLEIGVTRITKFISAKLPKGGKKDGLKKFDAEAREAGALGDGESKTFLAMKRKSATEDDED